MAMNDNYPEGFIHYGILDKLTSMVNGDISRVPRAGWVGTLRDLGNYMGLDPAMIAAEFGETLEEHDETPVLFDISPPPARPDYLKQKPEIAQWRKDEAHRIDPATTRELLSGR